MNIRNFYEGHKKAICVFAGMFTVGMAAYAFACQAPITRVGKGGGFSYIDLYNLSSTTSEIASIVGAKPSINPRLEAYQTLVVAAAEKEILRAENIEIRPEAATQMVMSNTPFRGVLEAKRKQLGDEKFYRIYIEPAATGELFLNYYNTQDPQRKLANDALELAKNVGIVAAAQKAGIQTQVVTIPRAPANEALFAAARSAGAGNLIDKIIEDGLGFYIGKVKDLDERSVSIEGMLVKRTPIGQFIQTKLADRKITLDVKAYSIYRLSDISKQGMVFAKEDNTDAKK